MNRTIGVMAGLLLALGASACVSDPSLEFAADPNQIAVDPDAMFLTYGVQKQALVRYVDDRNRATPAKFDITNVGPGITVTLDDQYRLDVIGSDTLTFREVQLQHRFFINTTEAAATGVKTSFTLSTGGVTTTVPVYVIPANLGNQLSTTAPELGQAVTITAPANLSFNSETSVVTLVDGSTTSTPVILERTADAITFVPRPGSTGVVRVTNVIMDYASTTPARTLSTTNTVTAPAITANPTIGNTSPALGDPVTITAGAGQAFSASSAVTFSPGGTAVVLSQTANTLTIIPGPSSSGPASVSGIVLTAHQGDALGTFTRTSTNSITVPPVVGNFVGAGVLFGEVTLTVPGMEFIEDPVVYIGGRAATTTGVAGDGSSMTFLAGAGPGPVTVDGLKFDAAEGVLNGVVLSGAPEFPETPWSGVDPDGNAPVLNVGAPGTPWTFTDSWTNVGPDPVGFGGTGTTGKWMKLVVTTGGTYTARLNWNSGADMDFGITNEGITAFLATALTTNKPESFNITLAPGTYWAVIGVYQGTNPPGRFTLTLE